MNLFESHCYVALTRASLAYAFAKSPPLWRLWWRIPGALLAALSMACGGGSDAGGVFIKGIEATPTQFSKTATVTVSGFGLNEGIYLTAEQGCENVTSLSGGNNLTRRFTCTVVASGPLTLRIQTGTGREVGRLEFIVPQPQVTLIVEGVGSQAQQIVLELDPERAPLSARNMLNYVNSRFYDGMIFHRVDPGNGVVQTGGFTAGPTFKSATREPIALESTNGLLNQRATLGMARTSQPDSASSQFYVNVRDNPAFDYQSQSNPGYAVFGAVVQGMDVIDAISASPTGTVQALDSSGLPITGSDGQPVLLASVPQRDIIIRSASQTR